MRRLFALFAVILVAGATALGAAPQQISRVPRVGLLTLSSQQNFQGKAAFLEG